MSGMRAIVCALLLGIWALAGACSETLAGDRCASSADCDPPLRCSNETAPEGTLGICVLPEGVPDAAVPGDAATEPDAAEITDAATVEDASPTADASP